MFFSFFLRERPPPPRHPLPLVTYELLRDSLPSLYYHKIIQQIIFAPFSDFQGISSLLIFYIVIMGQGGDVVIVNGTNVPMAKTNQHSYQMSWGGFPDSVSPCDVASVYVEFDDGIFQNSNDDSGDVTYVLQDGYNTTINIHASFRNIKVTTTITTNGSGRVLVEDLGWNHDGKIGYVIAGMYPNYYIQNSIAADSWMTTMASLIQSHSLSEICIPGSHDAGMCKLTSSTAASIASNTQTQSVNIYDQLMHGARYFDIRPIIGGGEYYTGHYSDIAGAWQGSRGQSIKEVIANINAFFHHSAAPLQEVVILELSHDYNTDVGYLDTSYRSFTTAEYNTLLEQFSAGLSANLYTRTNNNPMTIPLKELVGQGPVVIIVIDAGSDRNLTLPAGMYLSSTISYYNNYSDSQDVTKMVNDQLNKMRENSASRLFILSWTLTLQGFSNITGSIENLAAEAHQYLYPSILPAVSPTSRPNVIMVDYYDQHAFGALAVAVNMKLFHHA